MTRIYNSSCEDGANVFVASRLFTHEKVAKTHLHWILMRICIFRNLPNATSPCKYVVRKTDVFWIFHEFHLYFLWKYLTISSLNSQHYSIFTFWWLLCCVLSANMRVNQNTWQQNNATSTHCTAEVSSTYRRSFFIAASDHCRIVLARHRRHCWYININYSLTLTNTIGEAAIIKVLLHPKHISLAPNTQWL